MPALLEAYLTPSASAVKFAIKATLAMFLALYLALWFDLDRPYWALISAAFLQIRPMSGMVIEKGLCQIGGTFIGAVAGTVIMSLFVQARVPALITLTAWIMLCTYGSSLLRNNFSYGCIMAAVTAMLIVVIAGSNPASVFDVAVARLSELGLGAICATLVSSLLWPTRVREHLADQANTVINQAFLQAAQRLEASRDDAELQASLTGSLAPLTQLETDSQAARYEGPEGNGRVRATHVLTRRTLRFFATLHAMHHLLRDTRETLDSDIRELAGECARGFREAEDVEGVPAARRRLQALRHRALELDETRRAPLQRRLVLGLRDILGHAIVMLDAREAIVTPGSKHVRGGRLSWHRDHLAAGVNALRAGIVFGCLATFWILTHWSNGQVAMLLGTLFSAFFASRDNPVAITMMFYKGMLAAIPSAFLFGHVLLSQANGYPMLAMLFGTPLFLGLLGAGNPRTMGYCLAFTIFNILLTMPGNGMDFSFDSFANRAIAVIIGLSAVVMSFRLLPGLGATLRRRRLVGAIARDLRRLDQGSLGEAETRFSGHIADRLLALARHDDMLPEDQRHLFALGLSGLDLGASSLRLRQWLDDTRAAPVRRARRGYQQALAEAYQRCADGCTSPTLDDAGHTLLETVREHRALPEARIELLQGMLERLGLTLREQAERIAARSAKAPSR
ncbi:MULTISPECIES: FUSC family protein [unclassified Modicisalibacter]|uniref:FUSC family protein n=1 Tax=unclassified Modicisalibacter TaxID=2679913 RepID=UPI001CCDA52E|nr:MULTISPECIES: FUSC family protein [unclassified Modicisalibacter]MBZ9559829.1 FUSC family protein [Modicisalibacter sp. R2A 31.J]MBZ9577281.1 FUSC family protein [Modicisalibacter sp. MOD 31.J]